MPPRLPRRMLLLRAVLLALGAPWMCACTDTEERSSPAQQERRDDAHGTDPARDAREDAEAASSTSAAKAASLEPSAAWTGPATAWKSDDGVLSAELRQGWTIARAEAGRVLVDPGLRPTDTLDCLLVVVWGELDESQRALDAAGIMQAQDEELRAELRAQQVDLQRAKSTPTRVDAHGRDAAEQVYEGRAAGNPVRTWVGTTIQDGWHATVVAVVAAGREARFLPGAKRLLSSARLAAPKRDARAEARLVGAEFGGRQDFGAGGAIDVAYRFEGDGGVVRTSLVSGSFGVDGAVGGESTKRGRWTCDGERVRMRFDDGVEEALLELQGSRARALVVGRMRCARL